MGGGTSFKDFVGNVSSGGVPATGLIGVVSNIIVPILIALAGLVFIWGVIQYFFLHGSDEARRAEGRKFVLWGLIGLVVIFAVWSIVKLLLLTLGIAPAA